MSWPLASRTLYRATRLMRPAVGGPDPDGVCHWREAQDMERHSCPKKAKRWMNSEHPPEDSPSFRARPAGNGRRGPMCTVHTPNFRTGHCERSEPFRIDGLQSCFLARCTRRSPRSSIQSHASTGELHTPPEIDISVRRMTTWEPPPWDPSYHLSYREAQPLVPKSMDFGFGHPVRNPRGRYNGMLHLEKPVCR